MRILREPLPLKERLTAIYLRALKDDIFDLLRPSLSPVTPSGWHEAYDRYKSVSGDKQNEAWKGLEARFSGYLKAVESFRSSKIANKAFLEEMLNHFEELNMPTQVFKIKSALREFEDCFT